MRNTPFDASPATHWCAARPTARDTRHTAARVTLGVAVVAVLAASTGCRRATVQPAPTPAASVAATRPLDALDNGELAEGPAHAFELTLPRGFTVRRNFGDSVAATGSAPLESIEQYMRKHLDSDRVEASASRTVFDHARPKGGKNRWLRVEVATRNDGIEIVVRDITPPPDVPAADETERWRRAGLGPGGKQLDPSAYQ